MKDKGFAVDTIYISPDAGAPMIEVTTCAVIRERGLVGDRYASRKGFWQNIPKPANIGRDVSIINASEVEGTGFTGSDTRRNIFVTGSMRLTDLIGKTFYIGEILFSATEECTPCKRPSDLCGKPGFARALEDRGGIRACPMNDGSITIGDKYRPSDVTGRSRFP